MGWQGTDMLTNGEHDRLWRKAFTAIPSIEKELVIMNKLKYIELLKDAGMEQEVIRKVLIDISKDIGYTVSFDNDTKEKE